MLYLTQPQFYDAKHKITQILDGCYIVYVKAGYLRHTKKNKTHSICIISFVKLLNPIAIQISWFWNMFYKRLKYVSNVSAIIAITKTYMHLHPLHM